jgi:putative mRNA 3-end processing factor
MQQLVDFTSSGLYCPIADVYIDPWKPVDKAIITHAHSDHARIGNMDYLAHKDTIPLLKHQLGKYLSVQGLSYGESICMNGVKISLHPAGHIIGSAQVRIEYKGEVWVISGDYKLDADGISKPFESVKCDVFVTESTYGLPVFHWRNQMEVFAEINNWWAANAAANKTSILAGYVLGKAQRLICNLDNDIGDVYVHSSIENINQVLRANGTPIPQVNVIDAFTDFSKLTNAIVLAPPSTLNSAWIQKFESASVAIASGWMSLRGTRRRKDIDCGFVLSDHADWDQLKEAVTASGAKKVFVTHGYSSSLSRWMDTQGIDATEIETKFHGEMDEIQEVIINEGNISFYQ